jgi:hypothetical protein
MCIGHAGRFSAWAFSNLRHVFLAPEGVAVIKAVAEQFPGKLRGEMAQQVIADFRTYPAWEAASPAIDSYAP